MWGGPSPLKAMPLLGSWKQAEQAVEHKLLLNCVALLPLFSSCLEFLPWFFFMMDYDGCPQVVFGHKCFIIVGTIIGQNLQSYKSKQTFLIILNWNQIFLSYPAFSQSQGLQFSSTFQVARTPGAYYHVGLTFGLSWLFHVLHYRDRILSWFPN